MTGKKNLACRNSNGTMVTLAYDFDNEQCEIIVNRGTDNGSEDFTLYPPNPVALDCYYHPFAYADRVLTRGTFAEVS